MTSSETPSNIAKLATEKAKLPALALLGIFGSSSALQALIRTPDGNSMTVRTGDRVQRDTVAAIAEDYIVLSHGNRTKTLRLPAS
ncbi:Pilus assembly protein PilZ [Sulfitobacter noctilucicola]|uniref:Tfp pilus assembly protein PilP n=1 Tax=Sulfitobacter noctilucicola TaxID=1342301 RepID=A0A7W6M805_9RHOB|nr:hypothetical protein [Sulfitobacter noctilucicola]KIN64734.1 Pilus assembly protein PilZ [Sulfitobacter noctilucicola]MBB4174120.1 Tfp pilus assembly protein PilP [Sulfitobacter noctilucicola]